MRYYSTFVVSCKNPVGLSQAGTCNYFEINIDFQSVLKVKLLNQLVINIPSKIGFQLNEDKNNNGVVLETDCWTVFRGRGIPTDMLNGKAGL